MRLLRLLALVEEYFSVGGGVCVGATATLVSGAQVFGIELVPQPAALFVYDAVIQDAAIFGPQTPWETAMSGGGKRLREPDAGVFPQGHMVAVDPAAKMVFDPTFGQVNGAGIRTERHALAFKIPAVTNEAWELRLTRQLSVARSGQTDGVEIVAAYTPDFGPEDWRPLYDYNYKVYGQMGQSMAHEVLGAL